MYLKKLKNNFFIFIKIFRAYKLRSTLSILGVAFGTFALIVMIALSKGLELKAKKEVEQLGKNPIIVKAGKVFVFRRKSKTITTSTTLKLWQVKRIKHQIPEIVKAIPALTLDYPVRYRGKTIFTTIIGTTTDYYLYRHLKIKEGRFFTKEEEKEGAKVVVLGSKIAEKFFGNEDPLGKDILIFRVPVKVIGVLDEMGTDLAGTDQDILIYTPLKTAMRRLSNVDYINTIYIQVDDERNIPKVKKELKSLLRKLHKLKPSDKDDFTILTPDDLLFMQKKAMHIFVVLGLVSASISFIIGGIGILSIMILSVYERLEEIGIRRALGAKKSDIFLQFLSEATFISLTGGILGVIIGYMLSYLISSIFNIPFVVSVSLLTFAFFISFITGIIAGIYPSIKASSTKIIDILRG
jgi:putative ABC transport system permease protein